jgi:nitroreductase
MELMDVIRDRESIRSYDPERSVDREVLERILEAGRLAPSATNRQPWQILVFESDQALKKIKRCYAKEWFQDAPVVIAVKGRRADAWMRADGYNSLETDLTILMTHLILAAESEGLGTCWIANFDYEALRKELELGDDEHVYAITPLGYTPKEFSKKRKKVRKSLDEVAVFL